MDNRVRTPAVRGRLLLCVGVLVLVGAAGPVASAQQAPTLGFELTPSSGPPGTRVHFEGDVSPDAPDFDTYRLPDAAYGMQGDFADCELILPLDQFSSTVTDSGHVTGSYVVAQQGGCFMSATDLGPQQARSGVYTVLLSCHACTPIGNFTITAPSLARTGSATAGLLAAAAAVVTAGAALVSISRRRLRH